MKDRQGLLQAHISAPQQQRIEILKENYYNKRGRRPGLPQCNLQYDYFQEVSPSTGLSTQLSFSHCWQGKIDVKLLNSYLKNVLLQINIMIKRTTTFHTDPSLIPSFPLSPNFPLYIQPFPNPAFHSTPFPATMRQAPALPSSVFSEPYCSSSSLFAYIPVTISITKITSSRCTQ